jgi:hypothetical protein
MLYIGVERESLRGGGIIERQYRRVVCEEIALEHEQSAQDLKRLIQVDERYDHMFRRHKPMAEHDGVMFL